MSDAPADPGLPRHLVPIARGRHLVRVAVVVVALALAAAALQLAVGRAWLLLALVAAVGVVLTFNAWRVARQVQRIGRAAAALQSGDVASAAAEFQVLAHHTRFHPVLHALVVYNLGACRSWQGRLDEAIELMHAARRSGWLQRRYRTTYPVLLAGLANCYADNGEIAEARRWLELGLEATGVARAGVFLPPRAVILCREGNHQAAATLLRDEWAAAEQTLPTNHLQLLRVIRAFALSELERTEARELETALLLSEAGPSRPADFASTAAHWPEFGAFAREHGFLDDLTTADIGATIVEPEPPPERGGADQ